MTDYYKDKQQLTDEQITELAPDWATHYKEHDSDILFEGEEFFIYYDTILTRFRNKKSQLPWGINENSKPIPRKPFDISEHEFSYGEFTTCVVNGGELTVCDGKGYGKECKTFSKKDVIAMAKSLGVTAEDLK